MITQNSKQQKQDNAKNFFSPFNVPQIKSDTQKRIHQKRFLFVVKPQKKKENKRTKQKAERKKKKRKETKQKYPNENTYIMIIS